MGEVSHRCCLCLCSSFSLFVFYFITTQKGWWGRAGRGEINLAAPVGDFVSPLKGICAQCKTQNNWLGCAAGGQMLWNRWWTVAQEKVHAVEKKLWEDIGKRLTALNVEIRSSEGMNWSWANKDIQRHGHLSIHNVRQDYTLLICPTEDLICLIRSVWTLLYPCG